MPPRDLRSKSAQLAAIRSEVRSRVAFAKVHETACRNGVATNWHWMGRGHCDRQPGTLPQSPNTCLAAGRCQLILVRHKTQTDDKSQKYKQYIL